MKAIHFLSLLSFGVLLSACGAVRGGGDVNTGRQALFAGNNKAALGYFKEAQEEDPNFIHGAELREGVLSYLGRAQYLTGDYAQSASDFGKSACPAQERQRRTAIPWPYVVSSRRPKGGAGEYPKRYERN